MSECLLPEFFRISEPIAKRRHKCCECDAPIEVGEKHLVASGKWEGDFASYRQHLLCAQACMFIRDTFNDYECIGFGELMEWYGEWRTACRGEGHHVEIFRSLMAKIKWRERKSK